jgi:hypothetical protein
MSFLEILRKGATDAASLLRAADAAEGELPVARRRVEDAEGARRRALIDGDAARLSAAERALGEARLEAERAEIAGAELRRRAAVAEAAEAKAALDAERALVEKRAAMLAARLRGEYEKHAGAIVTLLSDLDDTENAVKAVNLLLHEAGRDDTVAAVETRVIGAGRNFEGVASLLSMTSLRPVGGMPGWGAGRLAAENWGMPA